jgi:LPS O-antigen subunit length determinant protein (WzzB/FepE family)
MVNNISTKDLIGKIYQWRKTFLWITLLSGLLTGIIVFLMPKQYLSTTVLFCTRQFTLSKLVIEANAGNQEDYMRIGDADDVERLLQVLNSDALKLRVTNAFDLWKRWKIKDTMYAYHYMKQKWDDMVSIKRTEYNSIKVEVYDYTANGAAEIANGIADYVDSVKQDMSKALTANILAAVKLEYENTMGRMKEMEDSLQVMRGLGVLHYKEQVKAYSRAHAKAIEENNGPAIKRLQGKLDTLEKFGGIYQVLHDNLDRYGAKYPDIKQKYDEALFNHNTVFPMKFVVTPAVPNEFKAKPKRLMYMIIAVLASNLVGLFVLLIRERFPRVKPTI